MRICLVSDAPEFCSTLDRHKITVLLKADFQAPLPEADLYIWDYHADGGLKPEALKETAQHLVLVHSKDLTALQSLEHLACILLKPVNAYTLRTFVDLAFKTWQLREQASLANLLRSDRDTLLQYVLEVNVKLQEYDHERSNFLARALHDFRTPLTALHGYCGLLAEEKLGAVNKSQRELLERMRNSTKRLTRLAAGTLDLLLQGRFDKTPSYKAGDIEATIRRALYDVHSLVQDKNVSVRIHITPPGNRFFFEPEQIQQVLVNLLENSCKFVPRTGSIEIWGQPILGSDYSITNHADAGPQTGAPDAYRIDVSDSGSGVAPELVDKIFEQFASYAGPNDRSGGGLGLAICKRIVGAHGGRIWATPGTGGRFSLVLPLHGTEEPASPRMEAAESLLEPESIS